MATPPLTTQEIANLLRQFADTISIGRYCTLSAWIMLLYDHLIHLDKEVELFWTKPWGITKCLYLTNRYVAPLFIGVHAMIFISPNVTDGMFEGYSGVTGIAIVELILGFRVIALWNRDKRVIAIVAFALLGEVAAMLTILSSTYAHMGATSTLFPTIPFKACVPFNIPPYFFAFWLPPLGYEFVVFVLAASKGYQTLRLAFKQFEFKTTGSRLIEVMIRDSLWYFLIIFICDMVCSLIWLKGPDSLLQAVAGFGLVIPSVAGSHLLLNLRDAYYNQTASLLTNTITNNNQRTTNVTIGGTNVKFLDRYKRQIHSYGLSTFSTQTRDEAVEDRGDIKGDVDPVSGKPATRSRRGFKLESNATTTTMSGTTAAQTDDPSQPAPGFQETDKGEDYELHHLPDLEPHDKSLSPGPTMV
ncbi:hypothetical protein FRC18_010319 [Serendipita sp. 400]|nr:hypothetical protein FRC18_010319 [Serendipita sp. 400]